MARQHDSPLPAASAAPTSVGASGYHAMFGPGLERLQSTAAGFWRWWRSELGAMLPSALRGLLEKGTQHVVIVMGRHEAEAILYSPGRRQVLGSTPLAPDLSAETSPSPFSGNQGLLDGAPETVLLLSQDHTLQTTLSLPVEAASNLREVLGYEIDRQTPFKADQVYFDYQVISREPGARKLQVSLTVVPRQRLDAAVNLVREWGLQPGVVATGEPGKSFPTEPGPPALNLLPTEQRIGRTGPWTFFNRLLAVSALCLLLASILIPLLRQNSEIRRLEAEVETYRSEAETTRSLQAELDRLIPQSQFILERKRQAPVVIDVMNELSLILPDDTWLQRFQIDGTSITIQGESTVASALIGMIEDSPMFRDTTFVTAVAHNPKTGQERFQIKAQVAGEPVF